MLNVALCLCVTIQTIQIYWYEWSGLTWSAYAGTPFCNATFGQSSSGRTLSFRTSILSSLELAQLWVMNWRHTKYTCYLLLFEALDQTYFLEVAACARCCGFIHSVPLQLEVSCQRLFCDVKLFVSLSCWEFGPRVFSLLQGIEIVVDKHIDNALQLFCVDFPLLLTCSSCRGHFWREPIYSIAFGTGRPPKAMAGQVKYASDRRHKVVEFESSILSSRIGCLTILLKCRRRRPKSICNCI